MDTLLFYINTIKRGGAERVILQLASHFAREGYRSVLVTSFADADKEYEVPTIVTRLSLEQEEIKQSRIKKNISRIKGLRKIIKKERPIVVLSFMEEPNFRAVLATFGLHTKCIVSVRNDPPKEYPGKIGKFVSNYILPHADGCVFQTEDAKAWFPKRMQKKSKVILNDVNEEFFRIRRDNSSNVISIGRLSKQKNHALLVDAFGKIADKYPDHKLLIYGSGVLEEDLKKQIKDLGIAEQVSLMGQTNNVAEALKHAGIFVLSSDFEGMPNCLMEALAVGVPSVSTDCPCGGPKTLIQNGENGLLVPVGDAEAMAQALDSLLSDSELAANLGRAAKEKAQQYHPDKIFSQWKSYVEEVIAR